MSPVNSPRSCTSVWNAAASAALLLLGTSALYAETHLVSHRADDGAATANGESRPRVQRRLISTNGNWVAFASRATNVALGGFDSNGTWDALVWSRATGNVELASHIAGDAGIAANGDSLPRAISDDGRYVLFQSNATDLVPGFVDGNGGALDAYLFDRESGNVHLISRIPTSAATSGNGQSIPRLLSSDGAWAVFESHATNLVSGQVDANSGEDVFLWERATGQVRLISHRPGLTSTAGSGRSLPQTMSPDGRWVAFNSRATNLVSGVEDLGADDAFLWDRVTDTTWAVSVHAGNSGILVGENCLPTAITSDGLYVAFTSDADHSGGDSNNLTDIYLFRRDAGSIDLVSHRAGEPGAGAGVSGTAAAISQDGRYVTFASDADDLVSGFLDQNGSAADAWQADVASGATSLVSHEVGASVLGANAGDCTPRAMGPSGQYVFFDCAATNLAANGGLDTNGANDVFVWNRDTGVVELISGAPATGGSLQEVGSSAPDAVRSLPAGNGVSNLFGAASDGSYVLIETMATDLDPGVTDGNGAWDVYVARNPLDPGIIWRDGFESAGCASWGGVVPGC